MHSLTKILKFATFTFRGSVEIFFFFLRLSSQNCRNFRKSMEPKWKLKYIFIFTHHWFTKVLKTPEKLSDSKVSSSSQLCITKCNYYNKTMKSNDFRHLCDNMCCKEVCILCFVKFVALVLFWYWKKSKWYEYFPLTISDHLYFHRTSKVWSMLHHGSMGRIQSKQCNSLFAFPFLVLLLLFFIKKFVLL